MKIITTKTKILILPITLLWELGCGINSYAGSTTANLSVSASVIANVDVVSHPVAFQNIDVRQRDATVKSALNIKLSSGVVASISLNQGQHPSSSSSDAVPLREMISSTGVKLAYTILQNDGVTAWGDTGETSATYVGKGTNDSMEVNFKINGGQNVPAGVYTDTVIATIKF